MASNHLETIVPSMLFETKGVQYERERITLPDDDFLDLDWLKNGHDRLIILSHGLEGSSDRQYMTRAAKYFNDRNWDVLAWNCRGCSGEVNKAKRTYQHGDVVDIGAVVSRALKDSYESIALIGYSMGGNMMLKYIAVNETDPRIKAAVGFSVPCNLEDSSSAINRKNNRFYEKRFLRKLRDKIVLKEDQYPELKTDWEQIHDFGDFNRVFTLPVFGFETEREFLNQARTDHILDQIQIPTLIVNALNDPMLEGRNYPFESAEQCEKVYLETPEVGGHVGFTLKWNDVSYMETRAEEFINSALLV